MNKMKIFSIVGVVLIIITVGGFKLFFSEEAQNKISRSITSTFGTKEGCLEVTIGGKPFRFMHVEKLSTAYGTDDHKPRPYRYGYGIIDRNLDGKVSPEELKQGKKYFEVPDFAQYIYYDASIK